MSETIYVGSGKELNGKYGVFHKLSLNKDDLETLSKNLNEKGWVNLLMNKRKNEGKYGETHSLTIDFWKPEKKEVKKEETSSNLPF